MYLHAFGSFCFCLKMWSHCREKKRHCIKTSVHTLPSLLCAVRCLHPVTHYKCQNDISPCAAHQLLRAAVALTDQRRTDTPDLPKGPFLPICTGGCHAVPPACAHSTWDWWAPYFTLSAQLGWCGEKLGTPRWACSCSRLQDAFAVCQLVCC